MVILLPYLRWNVDDWQAAAEVSSVPELDYKGAVPPQEVIIF